MKKTFWISFVLTGLLFSTSLAATPNLIEKDKLPGTTKMSAAKVMKKNNYKYIPNPKKWDYVFTSKTGNDFWLDPKSITAITENEKQIIRFDFCRNYSTVSDGMQVRTTLNRYCFCTASIDYDAQSFIISKAEVYGVKDANKLEVADLIQLSRNYRGEITVQELGKTQTFSQRDYIQRFAQLLRPYLTAKPTTPASTPAANKQQSPRKAPIKFI